MPFIKKLNLIPLLSGFLVLIPSLLLITLNFTNKKSLINKAQEQKKSLTYAVRGVSGDLWADAEVGRRDFAEIVARRVMPHKLNKPGGVAIDSRTSPGLMYIWDSNNNRVVGVNLERCYQKQPNCDGKPENCCSADIVFGQPSLEDWGACNRDSSFQTYPDRPSSSASTICGVSESTHTAVEDGTQVQLYVDSNGDLFIPDAMNNRVLKFIRPFETDTIADEVWGQDDFSGNLCNKTGKDKGGAEPTDSSLCFGSNRGGWSFGFGVTKDYEGSLWISDGGNNRILRFPIQRDGTISKRADIVIGQSDFTKAERGEPTDRSCTLRSQCVPMNKLTAPRGIAFDRNNNLYVADEKNARVLVFKFPWMNNQTAEIKYTGVLDSFQDVKIIKNPSDQNGEILMTFQRIDTGNQISLWNLDGTWRQNLDNCPLEPGGGSITMDNQNRIYSTNFWGTQGVTVLKMEPSGNGLVSCHEEKKFFTPPNDYNYRFADRFDAAAWIGVAVAGNQLVVGEGGRFFFWNDAKNIRNGQPPDGHLGIATASEYLCPGWTQVKTDDNNRVYVTRDERIEIYQAPLTRNSVPIKTINSAPTIEGTLVKFSENRTADYICNGGTYNPFGIMSLAPTKDGKYLWVSQTDQHRVMRIKNPLTDPKIDIILGQHNITGNGCNYGLAPEHAQNPPMDGLCYPGSLSIDKKGNLWVSDNVIEVRGNNRILMFEPSLFPQNPPHVYFGIIASKEIQSSRQGTGQYLSTSFDSENRMIAGPNPYSGQRFVAYFNNPTDNSKGPRDESYSKPDGFLKDFYGWAVASVFDEQNNLFVFDANRGQVRFYKNPFNIVNETDIKGRVYLQGRTNHFGTALLKLFNSNNNLLMEREISLDSNGDFQATLSGRLAVFEKYNLFVQKQGYLIKKLADLTWTNRGFSGGVLFKTLGGDATGDNQINALDEDFVKSRLWRKKDSDQNWERDLVGKADINADNKIDILDLVMVGQNMNKTGDIYPLAPTITPTPIPTLVPSITPIPTLVPTLVPTQVPTLIPTSVPTSVLSPTPTTDPRIIWQTEAEGRNYHTRDAYAWDASACYYTYIPVQNDRTYYYFDFRPGYQTHLFYLWSRVRAFSLAPYNTNQVCYYFDEEREGCIEYLPSADDWCDPECKWKWIKTNIFTTRPAYSVLGVRASKRNLNIDKLILTDDSNFVPTDANNISQCYQ